LLLLSLLQPPSSATSLPPCRIGWDRSHVLDTTDLDARPGQSSERRLCSWSRCLCAISTGCSQFDVKCSDSQQLALFGNILCSQHSSVWRCFISVGFYFHSSSHTGDRFPSREICDMDESVIETGENVCNTEHNLTFANLWSELNLDLFLHHSLFTRSHV